MLWKETPERDEAGSPNVVGAVAMALAAKALEKIGMDEVANHEAVLANKALEGLRKIPGIYFVGPETYDQETRVGVITFNLYGMHHSKTAAILGCEYGVAVRNGCFCAQPYVKQLIQCPEEKSETIMHKLRSNESVDLPGAVRASFGVYNLSLIHI